MANESNTMSGTAGIQPSIGSDGGPALPAGWRATALLTPFGQWMPPLASYNQLAIADIVYSGTDNQRMMGVALYLTESLVRFDLLFVSSFQNGAWQNAWACLSGQAVKSGTNLVVPGPNFMQQRNALYKGAWDLFARPKYHWLIETSEDDGQSYGCWLATDAVTGALSRVMNIPADNPLGIPILGSYFMSNLISFETIADAGELHAQGEALLAGGLDAEDYGNPLYVQAQITQFYSERMGLNGVPVTPADLQGLIPGYVNAPDWPLPEWPVTAAIRGYTLGMNTLPYITSVYYDAAIGKQRSEFVGWGPTPATEGYNMRQDTCLYSDYFNNVQYQQINGNWQPMKCTRVPGIGYPRRDFLKRMGGTVKAQIAGNAQFGLLPSQSIYITLAEMPRPAPKEGEPGYKADAQSYMSLFWDWWREDQSGVTFIECEEATPPRHALSTIDYTSFQRNAPVTPQDFYDPCQSQGEHQSHPATPAGHLGRSFNW